MTKIYKSKLKGLKLKLKNHKLDSKDKIESHKNFNKKQRKKTRN